MFGRGKKNEKEKEKTNRDTISLMRGCVRNSCLGGGVLAEGPGRPHLSSPALSSSTRTPTAHAWLAPFTERRTHTRGDTRTQNTQAHGDARGNTDTVYKHTQYTHSTHTVHTHTHTHRQWSSTYMPPALRSSSGAGPLHGSSRCSD